MLEIEKAKEAVAGAARQMLQAGLVTDTWGNISTMPAAGRIIITPSGLGYEKMNFTDLVVLDMQGELLEGRWQPSTEFPLHRAVYHARSDIKAIVHTHSLFATTLAAARRPLPVVTEEMALVIGHEIPVASFAAAGSEELAQNCLATLGGDKQALLMANHGFLGLGSDLPEAMKVCQVAETAARVFIYAAMAGGAQAIPADHAAAMHRYYLQHYGPHRRE